MEDARSKIVAMAMKDPAFRAALLNDASAAVQKELGVKIPSGLQIKVVEDTAALVHLVLPPALAKGALSDAELETVAGGALGTLMCDRGAAYNTCGS